MSTEQNYGGRANYATTTSQAVNSDPKSPLSAADRHHKQSLLDSLEREKQRTIEQIVREISGFNALSGDNNGAVGSLNRIVAHWITTEYKRMARFYPNDCDMEIFDSCVQDSIDAIAYMAFLSEQSTDLDRIDTEIKQLTKNLSGQ